MKWLKSNFNAVILLILLVLTGINCTACVLGYEYMPKSMIALTVSCIIAAIAAAYVSKRFGKKANKISNVSAYLMPTAAFLYTISIFAVFGENCSAVCGELIFAAAMSAAFIIFFCHNRFGWLKICAVICIALLAIVFLFVVSVTILFGGFGEDTVLQEAESPNGVYTVRTVSKDYGALGGDIYVYARNKQKDIPLLFGKFQKVEKILWKGDWEENPTLEWSDDDNLLIDGLECDMAYFLQSDYSGMCRYFAKLKVFVPQRDADYTNDTHGGFHGDGDTILEFVLTEEERKIMEEDIVKNSAWKKITPANAGVIYGGEEYGISIASENIPYTESGYYSIYNKQTDTNGIPGGEEYSYNYILSVYIPENNMLYIYELDT